MFSSSVCHICPCLTTPAAASDQSEAVSWSEQAAAPTLPGSFWAVLEASRAEAPAESGVPRASPGRGSGSSPSPEPEAARWTPPEIFWGQACVSACFGHPSSLYPHLNLPRGLDRRDVAAGSMVRASILLSKKSIRNHGYTPITRTSLQQEGKPVDSLLAGQSLWRKSDSAAELLLPLSGASHKASLHVHSEGGEWDAFFPIGCLEFSLNNKSNIRRGRKCQSPFLPRFRTLNIYCSFSRLSQIFPVWQIQMCLRQFQDSFIASLSNVHLEQHHLNSTILISPRCFYCTNEPKFCVGGEFKPLGQKAELDHTILSLS